MLDSLSSIKFRPAQCLSKMHVPYIKIQNLGVVGGKDYSRCGGAGFRPAGIDRASPFCPSCFRDTSGGHRSLEEDGELLGWGPGPLGGHGHFFRDCRTLAWDDVLLWQETAKLSAAPEVI